MDVARHWTLKALVLWELLLLQARTKQAFTAAPRTRLPPTLQPTDQTIRANTPCRRITRKTITTTTPTINLGRTVVIHMPALNSPSFVTFPLGGTHESRTRPSSRNKATPVSHRISKRAFSSSASTCSHCTVSFPDIPGGVMVEHSSCLIEALHALSSQAPACTPALDLFC